MYLSLYDGTGPYMLPVYRGVSFCKLQAIYIACYVQILYPRMWAINMALLAHDRPMYKNCTFTEW